ncbi:MAG TPA: GNAT family N-acetyltransferase [Steroidobacteraceae bacterium]|jgi:DNA-binding MarR family transcriptional regulator/GNAT superfamily N-acetyltransferase|nr:GNAT family N-acetyltransferase [Steroidobacteraceae bacterium]
MPAGNESATAAIRDFNRFYTRQLGLLDQGFLGSAFTLTEGRVLYEVAHRDSPTATDIARELSLDPGYLSRLLKKLERQGHLARGRDAEDGRQRPLRLTKTGRRVFEGLDRASGEQISTMIAALAPAQVSELVGSMQAVRRFLQSDASKNAYCLRPLRVGDIGWIIRRQGILYAEEYGWDVTYEGLVAEILSRFVKQFDPVRENAWVAERDGAVVGSVFLVRESAAIAKLRLLYVEPSARGLGIGRHLVDSCIAFAREKGYRTLRLWTNDILVSARRIYQAAGFRLMKEERHHSFGKELVGQTWELTLCPSGRRD